MSKPAVPERIAFIRQLEGYYDVFVVDADGRNTRRLTQGNEDALPGFYGGLAWSPDGTRLAFREDPVSPGGWEIFVAQADGGGVHLVTDNDWHDFHASWSPDGRIIFIASTKRRVVRVMDEDGGSVQDLTPNGWDQNPVWSPDGSRIAFSRQSPSGGSDYEIWVMDADGNNQRQLTDDDRWGENPSWSPDSTHIAFHSRIIVFDTVENRFKSLDDSEIFVVNADDGSIRQLADNAYGDYAPVWSPDGTRIAFQSYGGILLVDADGDNLRHLTYGADFRPVWWGTEKGGGLTAPGLKSVMFPPATPLTRARAEGSNFGRTPR